MRLAWGALLVVSAAGVVLACNDDSLTTVTPPGASPLAGVIDDPPGCLTTATEAEENALSYFDQNDDDDKNRLTLTLLKIDLIAAQCALLAAKAGGSQEAIDSEGFQVLQLVSESRDNRADQQGQGWDDNNAVLTAGSGLTKAVLAFMDVGDPSDVPLDFVPTLKTSGIFEVRGATGLSDTVPLNDSDPVTTLKHSHYEWGAELQDKTWTEAGTASSGTQVGMLIYGSPLAIDPLHPPVTEALVDRNENGNFELGEAAYSFNSLPVQSFEPEIRVGTCWSADDLLENAVVQRESGPSGLVVEYAGQADFCPVSPTSEASLGFRLLRFAADLLAAPLHAAAVVENTTGTSGTKSSFSNWFLVTLGTAKAEPTEGQPDMKVNDPLTLQINVTGEKDTPVEKALVTLTIETNKGQKATFCTIPCNDGEDDQNEKVSVLTDESGLASFMNYSVAKPGGYRVKADFAYPDPSEFSADYTGSFVTPLFNVSK